MADLLDFAGDPDTVPLIWDLGNDASGNEKRFQLAMISSAFDTSVSGIVAAATKLQANANNVNHPLIDVFQAVDFVPLLHCFFGDRGGATAWANLSETCYTFSSVRAGVLPRRAARVRPRRASRRAFASRRAVASSSFGRHRTPSAPRSPG